MSISEKVHVRDIVVGIAVIVAFVIAMIVVLNIYKGEGVKQSAAISDAGDKDPNHIEAIVKILSIDPIKGDISARIEFDPKGNLLDEKTGALARPVKFFVNSANAKQETDFAKGKRMQPVEVVISMYDGVVTDYPFDKHKGFLEMYFTVPAEKKPATPPAETPKPADSGETAAAPATTPTPAPEGAPAAEMPKPTDAPKVADEEVKNDPTGAADDVSIAVDFSGSLPGYRIQAEKTKDSDDDYVGIDLQVARSSTVVFYAGFVMFLMWGATLAVLFLTLSVVLRGRKIEVSMFSFLAAAIFAMIAVRNAQPAVPPIGTFSDFISFFWAEVILVLCLLTIIFTWLLRPVK
jgi:hypothetical protein